MKFNALVLASLSSILILSVVSKASNSVPLPTQQGSVAAATRTATLTARDSSAWINVRSSPTVQSSVLFTGYPGDRADVLNEQQGSDGYIWYYLRFPQINHAGWVRGDLVSVLNNPGTTAAAIQPSRFELPNLFRRDPAPPAGSYTSEQINYFMEIALGSEWGSGRRSIKKWQGDVRIRVNGSPTADDLQTLNAVINDLNSLIGDSVRVSIDNRNPNVEMHFAPESQFRQLEPNYVPRNLGFFWTRWQGDTINSARILISTTGVTQRERSHLIREELTQSMGLMRDSYRYRDSIFYQGWTSVTDYSEMDRAIISMLYRSDIRPGMTQTQVASVLQNASSQPSVTSRFLP